MARDNKLAAKIQVPVWSGYLLVFALAAVTTLMFVIMGNNVATQNERSNLSAEVTNLKAEIVDLEDALASSDTKARQCAASAELYAVSASTLSAYIVWLLEDQSISSTPDIQYAIDAFNKAEKLPCQ